MVVPEAENGTLQVGVLLDPYRQWFTGNDGVQDTVVRIEIPVDIPVDEVVPILRHDDELRAATAPVCLAYEELRRRRYDVHTFEIPWREIGKHGKP